MAYRFKKPDKSLCHWVYSFSSLQNIPTGNESIIIPNGKVDLLFSKDKNDELHITLMGLETKAKPVPKQPVTAFFAINFNPLAVQYILQHPIAHLLNSGEKMPHDFWGFQVTDLDDFDTFCHKAALKIKSLIPHKIDERKRKLFDLIFENNGEISIKELAEKISWSSRQINRYFNRYIGISLKTYNNIVRFQASLPHIKEGNITPQLDFSDQSHFIKEIKKLSGVSPKELAKNKNDRFLQFLVYSPK